MKRNIFILVFLLLCGLSVFAQKLSIRDSGEMIAYNGEGKYSIIIIVANDTYKLTFSTSQDGPDGSLIESEGQVVTGNQIAYTLTFESEASYGSTLKIECPGYNLLDLPIRLSPNQAIKYYVEDPEDPETKECSEKHWLIGEKYYLASNYVRAKDAYEESLNCWSLSSKIRKDEIEKRIADVDLILHYMKESANINLNYRELYTNYAAIVELNEYDVNAKKKRDEYGEAYANQCTSLKTIATTLLMEKKDVEKATTALNKYIEGGCGEIDWATSKLEEVKRWKKQFSRHTLTYEYAKEASLGLSTGNYNVGRSSGYFTLRMDPDIFKAFRMEDADTLQAEVNVSFGFTIPLFSHDLKSSSNVGLWLFLGPGMTMLTKIGEKYVTAPGDDGDQMPIENTERYKYHFAASPEAGLLFKIPIPGSQHHQIALRYTFQYRYAFKKEDVDLIGKTSNVFGIGFTF